MSVCERFICIMHVCLWPCVCICSSRLIHRQIGLVARLRQKWAKQGEQLCWVYVCVCVCLRCWNALSFLCSCSPGVSVETITNMTALMQLTGRSKVNNSRLNLVISCFLVVFLCNSTSCMLFRLFWWRDSELKRWHHLGLAQLILCFLLSLSFRVQGKMNWVISERSGSVVFRWGWCAV